MSEGGQAYVSVSLSEPRLATKETMRIAGVRRRHQMAGFDFVEFDRQIEAMFELLPGLSGRSSDRVYDIFWGMFTDLGGYFEYVVGVEVVGDASLPDGFTSLTLPAQRYIIVANRLDDSPRDTVFTLWHEWLPHVEVAHAGGDAPEFIYEHGEEYDENERPGPLDIYVPVKPAGPSRRH
jgi:AraC family transcriptional regulator